MTSVVGEAEAPPSASEIESLKRLAAGIIRAQGNRFIKELLRDKKIRIGANKEDFNRNLNAAIEIVVLGAAIAKASAVMRFVMRVSAIALALLLGGIAIAVLLRWLVSMRRRR